MKKLFTGLAMSLALIVGSLGFMAAPAQATVQPVVHGAQAGSWYNVVKGGCWLQVMYGTYFVPFGKVGIIASNPSDPCVLESTGVQVSFVQPGYSNEMTPMCTFGTYSTYGSPGCATYSGIGPGGTSARQVTSDHGTAYGILVQICTYSGCDQQYFTAF